MDLDNLNALLSWIFLIYASKMGKHFGQQNTKSERCISGWGSGRMTELGLLRVIHHGNRPSAQLLKADQDAPCKQAPFACV